MIDFTAYLKSIPSLMHLTPASKEDISNAENKLGVVFSNEYKDYLLTFGVATFDCHEFTGICQSPRLNVVDVSLDERQLCEHSCDSMYVVEQLNIDGVVIWQTRDGSIYQTISGSTPIKIASCLIEYLQIDSDLCNECSASDK